MATFTKPPPWVKTPPPAAPTAPAGKSPFAPSPWSDNQNWQETMKFMNANMPAWEGVRSADGNLDPRYGIDISGKLDPIKLNTQGLEALRGRALSTDTSPWAKLMLQKAEMDRAKAMDDAASHQKSGLAQGYSALATRGGLSQGARERMARKGMWDLMSTRQGVNRQGAEDRLGIMTQDENQRLDLLKSLPGMEAAALQPELEKAKIWGEVEKFNKSALIGDVDSKRNFELKKYEERMKAMGAERTAQATENSGGLTYLCTMANAAKPFTKDEWKSILKMRQWGFENEPEKIKFYIEECADLPNRIVQGGGNPLEVVKFTSETVKLIDEGDIKKAADFFWAHVVSYIKEYWPEIDSPLYQSIEKNKKAAPE